MVPADPRLGESASSQRLLALFLQQRPFRDDGILRSSDRALLHLLPGTALGCSGIQTRDVVFPLRNVHAIKAAVIRHKAVDFAFDIGRLRVDGAGAGEKFDLLLKLAE